MIFFQDTLYSAVRYPTIDCEQSLFFFRFSESNARARERRSAISHARGHLRVSRFARWTTEKRETARSLLRKRKHSAKHARFSCLLSIFNRTYANLSRPAQSKFDWDWGRLLNFFVRV